MRRKSLELIILAPVLIFLLLAGTSLYFLILTSVKDFSNKSIQESLYSMSRALYNITDREFDKQTREGHAGDEKWTKTSQVSVEMKVEDFARENNIGVIISDLNKNEIIFKTGISEDSLKIIKQFAQQPHQKSLSAGQGNYYYLSAEFTPWDWRIILVKDASAFSSLIVKVRNFYLMTGIILLFIAIFLIAYLRHIIGHPINKIVESIREGIPPEYKGISQLEFLSDTFAQFMESLQKHRDHLEELVKARTTELQEAKFNAEMANQAKSRFLALVSHELQTPLASIQQYTSLVMRQSKDILPAKQYENLQRILIRYDQLSALIKDLLDLSKIEAGRMDIYPVEFLLEPVVNECLHTIEPMIKGKNLRLVKELEIGQSILYTDRDKVKQILNNLLSNALKFTEEGTITVSASLRNGEIKISVADTGIGIPKDKHKLLFQDFYQVDDSSIRKYGGTGLGLAISRSLARLMGGNITMESIVGVGSTFTVTIPMHYRKDMFRDN